MDKTQITEIIFYIKGAEFSKEKSPVYIQELLHYAFVDCIVGIIEFFIFAITIFTIVLYTNKRDLLLPIVNILFFPLIIFFIFKLFFDIDDLIKLKTAPRVYVLDYLIKNYK
jgi:hypothetical protein